MQNNYRNGVQSHWIYRMGDLNMKNKQTKQNKTNGINDVFLIA